MRIKDLFEQSEENPFDDVDFADNSPDVLTNLTKSGRDSVVSPHPSDPHMVIKKERYYRDPKVNPYYQYIKTIQNAQLSQGNPYLPRVTVLSARANPDQPTEIEITYEIEKLFDPSDLYGHLSLRIIKGLGDRMFNDYENLITRYRLDNLGLNQWEVLAGLIQYVAEDEEWDLVKDPLLTKALQTIRLVKDRTRTSHWDINSKNIMLRLSGKGPQVVITDPLT